MKKLVSIFVFSVFMLCTQAQKINDPNAEVREAKGFHAISVSSAFDVFISQGDEEVVAVSASEEKYRADIKVEVKDSVLRIRFEKEGMFWKGWNSDKLKLRVYISFKNIDKLTASGACDVRIQGTIKVGNFTVNLSGASDLKEGNINANKLNANLNGASAMNISGSARELHVEASGASDFKGFDFSVDYCDAHATGASRINITVNKELSAHASGASDVHYKGDGLIKNIKTSGASNVSKRS